MRYYRANELHQLSTVCWASGNSTITVPFGKVGFLSWLEADPFLERILGMFTMKKPVSICILVCLGCGISKWADASELKESLTLFASFDESTNADHAKGDAKIYTAADLSRASLQPGIHTDKVSLSAKGRWGGGLAFSDNTKQVILFKGAGNVPYRADGFDMTISFWMSVDPVNGLKPVYVDPLQITDKKWNDAAIWVDFSKDDKPRHFRLGVLSDLKHWNPKNADWDKMDPDKRPLVTVTKTPFGGDKWNHVAITLKNINRGDSSGRAVLFLDGKSQGEISGNLKYSWDIEKVAAMLGIAYIGHIDEFAIFDKSLSADEVVRLMKTEGGIRKL